MGSRQFLSGRELGPAIRVVLSARCERFFWLVFQQGMGLALTGISRRLGGALGLTRVMSSLRFRVNASDPLTFGSVLVLLIAVALAACFFAARRAIRVDPMVALRTE
jgi:ABC-type lipoprotein release transport system permease subunit